MPSVNYAKCRKQAHYPECSYAEPHNAECCGALKLAELLNIALCSIPCLRLGCTSVLVLCDKHTNLLHSGEKFYSTRPGSEFMLTHSAKG
jgi:hypothetical protein